MIKVKILKENAKVPVKAKSGDAGWDLFTPIDFQIEKYGIKRIGLGIAVEIPLGHSFIVHEKSGLAANHGICTIGNVIDSGYRGEIHVILVNFGPDIVFEKGQKIAQALLVQCYTGTEVEVVDTLSETDRGTGGFGSTGKF